MNRRDFLARLGYGTISAAAAGLDWDVERLLWVPRPQIIVPRMPQMYAGRPVVWDDAAPLNFIFTREYMGPFHCNPHTKVHEITGMQDIHRYRVVRNDPS